MARRAYGSGSLTIRRDAHGKETWYGVWRTGGRRVKRALGRKRSPGARAGLSRSDAEAELRRRMGEQVLALSQAERKTVEDAGAAYVEHLRTIKQRKRTTLADYRGHLSAHLVPYFADRRMDRIEPEHVEAYMHLKLRTLSSKTVTNHLTFLHGLFAFALRRRWVTRNPVAMVDRPPVARQHVRRIQFLELEEVEALLRAVPRDTLGAVEKPLYLCAVMTGLRQGELLALKWIDIDWNASRVRVADNYPRGSTAEAGSPKSGYVRSVPMADRLAGELDRHSDARPTRRHTTWCSAIPRPAASSTRQSCAGGLLRRLRGRRST